jgi:hypothetical protein
MLYLTAHSHCLIWLWAIVSSCWRCCYHSLSPCPCYVVIRCLCTVRCITVFRHCVVSFTCLPFSQPALSVLAFACYVLFFFFFLLSSWVVLFLIFYLHQDVDLHLDSYLCLSDCLFRLSSCISSRCSSHNPYLFIDVHMIAGHLSIHIYYIHVLLYMFPLSYMFSRYYSYPYSTCFPIIQ